MNKHIQPLIIFFTLAIVTLACAAPIPAMGQPTPASGAATLPASPNPTGLGTTVGMTLTALVPDLLPHTFYFLAPDNTGHLQVFCIETDGTTRRQITSESVSVIDYDVSLADGKVAYVANNQLLFINADGSERRVLVDGGAVDPKYPFLNSVSSPVFSPDGQTLAYGYKGLQLYSISTDKSQMIVEDHVVFEGERWNPHELYSPGRYSPDGTKLLVKVTLYEATVALIYYPASNVVVKFDGTLFCCDETEWSADSSSVYAARFWRGRVALSGLWRLDIAEDPKLSKVTELIRYLDYIEDDTYYNAVSEAYLASDGQLYFFLAMLYNPQEIAMLHQSVRLPFQLVRSAPDGVTGRTILSTEVFSFLNEALWAPDVSVVVTAIAPNQEIYQGGQAEIVYLDGRPTVVLAPFAQQMKWGP